MNTEDSKTAEASESPTTRIIDSHELLQDKKEVWIQHRDELYRLKLTHSGKLILTK